MKRFVILWIVLLTPMLLAESEEVKEWIDALLETVDLSEWDAWFKQENGEGSMLPSDCLRALASTEGDSGLEITLEKAGKLLLPALRPAAVTVMLLMGLSFAGAVLHGISDTSSVGETALFAFRICAAGTVLALAFQVIRSTVSAIGMIGRTGEWILPAIIGFLTVSGMENTALLLSGTQALFSETVLRALEYWIVPLAVLGGVFSVLDLSAECRLASIGRLMHRCAKWILGTACSLFLTVTAIRSVAAGNADALLLKTTKLAAGSIPSVGSLLSESVDTAFQCIRFVKNILGLTGCIAVLLIAVKPVLSVFVTRCAVRISALLSEPLSGKPYSDMLRAMADTLHLLMLSEIAATAMILMMIAPVFGIGAFL